VEPSTFAASYAAAAGLDIFQGNVREYSPGRTFDLITLWNVIEHLRRRPPTSTGSDSSSRRAERSPSSPRTSARTRHAHLPDWAGLEVPKHLQLFDGSSLRALATNAGLSQVSVRLRV